MREDFNNNLIIWDQNGSPPDKVKCLLWNGYQDSDYHYSLLNYIDIHSDRLRSEYLSIIYNLSQIEISGKRIVEYLAITHDFSLWWMNLLAEKNPVKSKTIQTALRLLAIRDLIKELNPAQIELYSSNKTVSRALTELCELHKISFVFHYQKKINQEVNILSIIKRLPYVIQGFLFIINHIIKRWTLRNIEKPKWYSNNSSVFIFSYFFNLDKKKCSQGEFYSRQWEMFPKYLVNNGKKINWFHHYLSTSNEPDTSTANRWISNFNKNKIPNTHYLLDSFLSFNIIVRTIKQWIKFIIKTKNLGKGIYQSLKIIDQNWLWYIMLDDWKNSVQGPSAMQNILWVNLLDKSMSSIPQQNLGLYLCENMDWERAFIYFWRKYNHGKLIAVPHATVRYWDLRYFEDIRIWNSNDIFRQPIADHIAVNGPLSWNTYKKAGHPIDRMIKVEALRYLHLNKHKRPKLLNNKNYTIKRKKKKLLLLSDLASDTTDAMLNLLECSFETLKMKFDLTLKSHPANPVNIDKYPTLDVAISNENLEILFQKHQGIICSIYTSAAVEAASIGMPIITILDNNELNFSPLYDLNKTRYVSTNSELEEALIIQYNKKKDIDNNDTYFWTNKNLPHWGKLLEIN